MALPKQKISPQAYLVAERLSETKHEYYNGDVYDMAGASRSHILIVSMITTILNNQLQGKTCSVYPNDMRVKVAKSGLYTYPDVVITCGEEIFDDKHKDTLLNPLILIEVLSPSTESYDRGQKFQFYRQLPSLMEYVLISQETAHVENFTRQYDGWLLTDAIGLEAAIRLDAIDCTLNLSDVYAKVTFESKPQTDAN